jgi:hypothetical protein
VIAEKREARPAGPPPPPPGEEPEFVSGVVSAPVEVEKPAPVLPPKPAEAERVRAAVTLALDAAFPKIVDEVTRQVLRALHTKQ